MRPAITWAFEACWLGPDVLSDKKSDIATISKLCLLLLDIQFQAYVVVILLLIFNSVTFATNVLISPLIALLVKIQKHNVHFLRIISFYSGMHASYAAALKKTNNITTMKRPWGGSEAFETFHMSLSVKWL